MNAIMTTRLLPGQVQACRSISKVSTIYVTVMYITAGRFRMPALCKVVDGESTAKRVSLSKNQQRDIDHNVHSLLFWHHLLCRC